MKKHHLYGTTETLLQAAIVNGCFFANHVARECGTRKKQSEFKIRSPRTSLGRSYDRDAASANSFQLRLTGRFSKPSCSLEIAGPSRSLLKGDAYFPDSGSQYIALLDDPIPGRQPGGIGETEKWWVEWQGGPERVGCLLRPRHHGQALASSVLQGIAVSLDTLSF